ncbi:hypothetical protein [Ornithinimicrobium kibberense]|uniref:hypothetical protein n=1 Tax=Ornithinimicrobium kibberense TaxID=282060 RepID=UPI00360C8688
MRPGQRHPEHLLGLRGTVRGQRLRRASGGPARVGRDVDHHRGVGGRGRPGVRPLTRRDDDRHGAVVVDEPAGGGPQAQPGEPAGAAPTDDQQARTDVGGCSTLLLPFPPGPAAALERGPQRRGGGPLPPVGGRDRSPPGRGRLRGRPGDRGGGGGRPVHAHQHRTQGPNRGAHDPTPDLSAGTARATPGPTTHPGPGRTRTPGSTRSRPSRSHR